MPWQEEDVQVGGGKKKKNRDRRNNGNGGDGKGKGKGKGKNGGNKENGCPCDLSSADLDKIADIKERSKVLTELYDWYALFSKTFKVDRLKKLRDSKYAPVNLKRLVNDAVDASELAARNFATVTTLHSQLRFQAEVVKDRFLEATSRTVIDPADSSSLQRLYLDKELQFRFQYFHRLMTSANYSIVEMVRTSNLPRGDLLPGFKRVLDGASASGDPLQIESAFFRLECDHANGFYFYAFYTTNKAEDVYVRFKFTKPDKPDAVTPNVIQDVQMGLASEFTAVNTSTVFDGSSKDSFNLLYGSPGSITKTPSRRRSYRSRRSSSRS